MYVGLLSSPYLLKRRSVIADTVLSITFNTMTSRKLKKLCREVARTCCISRVFSMGLFTRVMAARWTEGRAMFCL